MKITKLIKKTLKNTFKYFRPAFFVMLTLEIHSKIKDVDVKPESRFSLEYGISQYVNEWLEIQLINSHNWQSRKR